MKFRIAAALAVAMALASPARAEPPIWVVRDADSEVVLFGSIHVLPPGLNWRPAALDAALSRADDVWFELPISPEADQEVARLAAGVGLQPPGGSLFASLGPDDAARLSHLATKLGVDAANLDRLKPWLAEAALGLAAYAKAGADVSSGVEKQLSAATPVGARRRAFETPAEQVEILSGGTEAEQLAALRQTLTDLEAKPNQYAEMVSAWLGGRLDILSAEVLDEIARVSPAAYDRLITARNAAWTRTLDARLKGSGRTVVVVGAGHLIGPGGVPERLRALGYSVAGP